MLILSPVPQDITVLIHVVVGGITFDDGTTDRTLTAADFDMLGQYKFRFIVPAGARTANCHTIKVMQGQTLLGMY